MTNTTSGPVWTDTHTHTHGLVTAVSLPLFSFGQPRHTHWSACIRLHKQLFHVKHQNEGHFKNEIISAGTTLLHVLRGLTFDSMITAVLLFFFFFNTTSQHFNVINFKRPGNSPTLSWNCYLIGDMVLVTYRSVVIFGYYANSMRGRWPTMKLREILRTTSSKRIHKHVLVYELLL